MVTKDVPPGATVPSSPSVYELSTFSCESMISRCGRELSKPSDVKRMTYSLPPAETVEREKELAAAAAMLAERSARAVTCPTAGGNTPLKSTSHESSGRSAMTTAKSRRQFRGSTPILEPRMRFFTFYHHCSYRVSARVAGSHTTQYVPDIPAATFVWLTHFSDKVLTVSGASSVNRTSAPSVLS